MLSTLSRWFAGKASSQTVGAGKSDVLNDHYRFQLGVPYAGDLEADDIPRYPPFAKGFPLTPVDVMLESQRGLILRLQRSLGLCQEEFESLLLPVLRRYAAFVHQLPASEQHHHRGAGGLMRHGLEVAFWAAQASEASIFNKHDLPKRRKHNEQRWRVAVALAGMMHDIGKPITDVTIVNKSGELKWNPFSQSLVEWAHENSVERYFLRWNRNRYRRHEELAHYALTHVMPREIVTYLSEGGEDVIREMQGAIISANPSMVVGGLVLKADQISVSRDLEANNLKVDEYAYGVTVEPYVIDAIRRLVRSGRWKSNEVGAAVWVTTQGLFLNWRLAASDVVELLDELKIPGVPRDADTLADLLIQRGAAIGKPVAGAPDTVHPYWEVQPKVLQEGEIAAKVTLLMLRLSSVSQLYFNTDPPEEVEADIVEPTQDQPTLTLANGSDDQEADEQEADEQIDEGVSSSPEPEILAIARVSDVPLAEMMDGLVGTANGKGDDPATTSPSAEPAEESVAVDPASDEKCQASSQSQASDPEERANPNGADVTPVAESNNESLGSLAALGMGVGMDMPFGPPSEPATKASDKSPATEAVAPMEFGPSTSGTTQSDAKATPKPEPKTKGKRKPEVQRKTDQEALNEVGAWSFGPIDGLEAVMPHDDPDNTWHRDDPVALTSKAGSVDDMDFGPSSSPQKKKKPQRASRSKKGEARTPPLESSMAIGSAPVTTPSLVTSDRSTLIAPDEALIESSTPDNGDVASERHQAGQAPLIHSERKEPEARTETAIDWNAHGEAGSLLRRLAEPLLRGDSLLGDALYLVNGKLTILFPQGVDAMGDKGEVLAVLDRAGMIDTGTKGSNDIVGQVDGLDLVLLQGELPKRILTEIERLADSNEPFLEQEEPSTLEPMPETEPQPPTATRVERASPSTTVAPEDDTSSGGAALDEPRAYPQYTLPAPKTRKSRKRTDRHSETRSEKKGRTRPASRDLPEPVDDTHDTGEEAEDADLFEGLGPVSTLDPLEALGMLTEMIRARKGAWLIGGVIEENGWLRTSDKALDVIVGHYPMLTKSKLRLPLMLRQFASIKQANGSLYVRIEDE